MAKTVLAAVLLAISSLLSSLAFADNNGNLNVTQTDKNISEGMEARSIDSNPGYKVLIPKGSVIRKQGDLRVVEGSEEYSARKFAEYDAQLAKISSDIEELKKEIGELKNR